MTKRKPAKTKTLAYIQDWGTYDNETFVVVGMDHKEILAGMAKVGTLPQVLAAYEKVGSYDFCGFVWNYQGCTVLWLREWRYDADHLDTLVHETNHLIHDILVKRKDMGGEMEAQAYQQAYLFTNILKRLNRTFGRRVK